MRPSFLVSTFVMALNLGTCFTNAENEEFVSDPVPFTIRAFWMRRAICALSDLVSPCPFGAFGAVIVNHTASLEGELVCLGVNSVREEGNPTLHGEIAAINNCSKILTAIDGPYKLSSREALDAYSQLSLCTTAEACSMCATAIRYGQFAEYVYATSSDTLIEMGWPQIDINSREVFRRSQGLAKQTRLVQTVLANETDELFEWQWRKDGECPKGCARSGDREECAPLEIKAEHDEL